MRQNTITRHRTSQHPPVVPSVSLNDEHPVVPNTPSSSRPQSSYVVFSGGTAANDFVSAFRDYETSFVLPGESRL